MKVIPISKTTYQSTHGVGASVVGGGTADLGARRLVVEQERPEPARHRVVSHEPEVVLVELERERELLLEL